MVQTTWLELVRRLYEIRSPQALTAWLVSATKRGARRPANAACARRPRTGRHPRCGRIRGPDPTERLGHRERDRVLMAALPSLPERCRALLRAVAKVDRPDYGGRRSAGDATGQHRTDPRAMSRETPRMLLADPAWSAP